MEVQTRKFAEIFERRLIVNLRGLNELIWWEVSEKRVPAVGFDADVPLLIPSLPANALEAGFVVGRLAHVVAIFSVRGSAKILSSAVQAIMIFMVNLLSAVSCVKNKAMEENIVSLPVPLLIAFGVHLPNCSVFVPINMSVPFALGAPFVIGGID